MEFIYKFLKDANIYNRLLNSELAYVLLEFIDERDFVLQGDMFECFLSVNQVKVLLDKLEEESYSYYLDEKLNDSDYTSCFTETYIKRMSEIMNLETELNEIGISTSELEFLVIKIDKNHLAFQSTFEKRLTEAVNHLQKLSKVHTSITYEHDIDLPNAIEPNFFEHLQINWSWGIGIIRKEDELFLNNYIPLKGFQVSIETEVKQYFTNAVEVTYTAYHIYRNAKDHRYQYKQKRAQRSYRFIIDMDRMIEVNYSNEQQYNHLVEEANQLQISFIKKAEQSLKRLFKINQMIQKTFNKNAQYYEKMMHRIKDFLENDYLLVIRVYFLLEHINYEEYVYHCALIQKLKEKIKKIRAIKSINQSEPEILTQQAALIRAFLVTTEMAPRAGVLEIQKNIVHRTLMQIEAERGYSEEYRSDDSLQTHYRELSAKKI